MESQPVPNARAKRWLAFAALAGLTAIGAATLASTRSEPGASTPSPTPAAESSVPRAPSYPIPSFGRPEEAKRYLNAMIQGDERAIQELDRALEQAKTQSITTPSYLDQLQHLRADRVERLAAHRSARRP